MKIESKNKIHEVLFDESDQELIEQYHWNIIKDKSKNTHYVKGYLKGSHWKSRKSIFMHRLIMGLDGPLVDHKNRDGLDNRRENLRHITKAGNARNSVQRTGSLPRGVSLINKRVYYIKKTYQANILIDGKLVCLGTFDTPEEASDVYQKENINQIKKEIL